MIKDTDGFLASIVAASPPTPELTRDRAQKVLEEAIHILGHITMLRHATDTTLVTGWTVILCQRGAMGGVAVFGAAAGTRETDLLEPGNRVEHVTAVVLTGGSAFGLEPAQMVAGLPVSFSTYCLRRASTCLSIARIAPLLTKPCPHGLIMC